MTGPAVSPPSGFKSFRKGARRRSLVSLTPLIDVVFILLVFFMLASSFLDWRVIGLETPRRSQPVSQPSPESTTLMVDVEAGGLRLGGQPATLDEIARLAAERLATNGDQRVLVRPSPGVPLQRAVTVLDRLSAVGVTNMALTRRPGQGAGEGAGGENG